MPESTSNPDNEQVFAAKVEVTPELLEANPLLSELGFEQDTTIILASTDPSKPRPIKP